MTGLEPEWPMDARAITYPYAGRSTTIQVGYTSDVLLIGGIVKRITVFEARHNMLRFSVETDHGNEAFSICCDYVVRWKSDS